MPLRQAHRHVEVVGATGQRAVEDRHHEPRVDGVHDVGDVVAANEFCDVVGRRRVHPRRGEPRIADRVSGLRGPRLVVVADDDVVEEISSCSDGAECVFESKCHSLALQDRASSIRSGSTD